MDVLEQKTVYLSLKEKTEVETDRVRVKDVADLYSANEQLLKKVGEVTLFSFTAHSRKAGQKKPERQIVTLMYIMERISKEGMHCRIFPIGMLDCIVEPKKQKSKSGISLALKLLFVSVICLFGGMFSIMSFHNDISVNHLFFNIYRAVTGMESTGFTVLEVSYSLGLFIGILIFYNHVGKRRISVDPTPIEVSMRNYEQQMDESLVQSWEREGKKIDAIKP